MPLFQRDDWIIEVEATTWAEIINFLTKCGWRPSVPAYYLFASDFDVSNEDATSLSKAGQIVLEETIKNPLDAYSAIDFDMGKFAEIVEFASHGAFFIKPKQNQMPT